MTTPLWIPSRDRVRRAAITAFREQLERDLGRPLPSYRDLHRWSIEEPAAFWERCLRESGIRFVGGSSEVMSRDPMPYTRWFEGVSLNYADALLYPPSNPDGEAPAIIAVDESGSDRTLTWNALRAQVAGTAAALAREGVGPGDRVAAFIANVPEAVILLLACASRGAIFSSCSPDFGVDAAHARFHQIAPAVLVASTGYEYNGRRFDTTPVIAELGSRLTPPPRIVCLGPRASCREGWTPWDEWIAGEIGQLETPPLPFEHPLYVLYSSGTTGLPKAMVHRTGGVLLKHHTELRLHGDVGPGDRLLYFTTCGWMMWNWLVSALAQGATIVLFDGSPSHPSLEILWKHVERLRITHFGT
ncbi:MAG TPA: AMP-binding protein, partial [Vicinamibacterales bacterium]